MKKKEDSGSSRSSIRRHYCTTAHGHVTANAPTSILAEMFINTDDDDDTVVIEDHVTTPISTPVKQKSEDLVATAIPRTSSFEEEVEEEALSDDLITALQPTPPPPPPATVKISSASPLVEQLPSGIASDPKVAAPLLPFKCKILAAFIIPKPIMIPEGKPPMIDIGLEKYEGRVRKIRDWFEKKQRLKFPQMKMEDDSEETNLIPILNEDERSA